MGEASSTHYTCEVDFIGISWRLHSKSSTLGHSVFPSHELSPTASRPSEIHRKGCILMISMWTLYCYTQVDKVVTVQELPNWTHFTVIGLFIKLHYQAVWIKINLIDFFRVQLASIRNVINPGGKHRNYKTSQTGAKDGDLDCNLDEQVPPLN